MSEWHPAKTQQGDPTYNFVVEMLSTAEYAQPQCVDLYSLLESVLDTDDGGVSLQPLHRLLVALIETGQRHVGHGVDPPVWGGHVCARKGSHSKGTCHVYCRYLFPRALRFFAQLRGSVVKDDPHRPGLKNLFLARNDPLLNGFEAHLLLANLGNIDWRALLNLWAVLEYLTKYTAKAGKGSLSFKKTFSNVTAAIYEFGFEKNDGLKDLWRTAIMKFYSRVLGGPRLLFVGKRALWFTPTGNAVELWPGAVCERVELVHGEVGPCFERPSKRRSCNLGQQEGDVRRPRDFETARDYTTLRLGELVHVRFLAFVRRRWRQART